MPSSILAPLEAFAVDLSTAFGLKATIACNPEDQLKSPVATLVKQAGDKLGLKVETVTEVHEKEIGGRPDMGITVAGLLSGHIELKAPGKGADPKKLKGPDKDQWEKFKELPNLLYTDGNEWALYRDGVRVGKLIRLSGDVTEDGKAAVNAADAEALHELFREFLRWEPVVPSSPKALAVMLAPLCRLLRRDVATALKSPESSLAALAADWRIYLFPDADDDQFADAYAQTLTYALLLARLSGESEITPASASKAIRSGHRLLADALKILGDDVACAEIMLPVSLLERVIAAVDIIALSKKAKGDPWLYFYEDFLAAYDPKMRKDRGVYYTPVEVVQAQVRLVAELLEERFDAEYSFVDPNVLTLDPAAGTGTYVLAALRHSLEKVAAIKGPGMKATAANTAAKNMHAFELLVGPYAVAHLRLTQQILAEGGTPPSDGVHVYLTDTLESPFAPPPHYPALYKPLGEEHTRAQRIKAETPVLVCIGNPPYDRQTIDAEHQETEKRKGGWVRFGNEGRDGSGILHDFLDPLGHLGFGVHAQSLYNDYVYFWRWALWKVYENTKGPGIVSFITASSYLRGPAFAGMRKVMRETFDDLWIIDLEGDNLGARKTENVFSIRTPVAIAIGMRGPSQSQVKPAETHYVRIEGSAEDKLAKLAPIEHFNDLTWQRCPTGWTDVFLPVLETPYTTWPLLTNLFPWQENGMQFKRSWPIAEDTNVLERRWKALINGSDKKKLFKETRDRKINKSYPLLSGSGVKLPPISELSVDSSHPVISRIAYRSFDRQWAFIDSRVGDYLRPQIHQTYSSNQIFMTSMLTNVLGEGPSAIATSLIPDMDHFRGSFGAKHVIPLWINIEGTDANVTAGVLTLLTTTYGREVTAEELFAFAYAVLASPLYVLSHWEELRNPGPRLPIPKDTDLFTRLAAQGRHLIWLHTYGERCIPSGKKAGRIPAGKALCSKGTPTDPDEYPEEYSYDLGKQELHVGKGVFSGVRKEVWEFSVSGLQVVDSWLGYRMKKRAGKKSSPLDDIRPAFWQFDDELLQLLWVLDATVDLLPTLETLLRELLAADLFTATDFPLPSDAERNGPKTAASASSEQTGFDFAATE